MAQVRHYGFERSRGAARGVPRGRFVAIVITLVLNPALPGTSNAETISAERAGAAARAEIAKGRYQRALPKPPKIEDEIRQPPASKADRPVIRPRVREPESTGDVAQLVLWVLIAIVGVLLVVFIANELPRFLQRRSNSGDARVDGVATDEADHQPVPDELLHEADRLAREGAYGSAIHVMLLALIDALHGPIGRRLARSLTGREIVGAAGLAARSGAALSRIVAAAERSHFGGYNSNRTDYETCRQDYAAVATDLGDRV